MPDLPSAVPPRFDVITIFPAYLAPLDLSLVGKARESGLVEVHVHDLRDATSDRHRTVDDAPLGGGAGMVMKPDVWWRAIEATRLEDARDAVVLIPTPSGEPLTQARVAALADRLSQPGVRAVIACGRYEGIDARLAQHLDGAPGVCEVVEFSLGDYVLNGGEVAALALLEGVVRLLPGVLGNPASVVEESFSDDLLEYPVYTRPAEWEGLEAPEVLLSGHHARIERWRRDASLRRTARRRPELLRRLDPARLDARDREVLAEEGVVLGRHGGLLGPVALRAGVTGDGAALADLAALTFPLACPGHTTLEEVRRHVEEHLSAAVFERHLADPDHHVVVMADIDGQPVGYALVVLGDQARLGGAPSGPGVPEPLAELSKLYLLPRARGTGLAGTLMVGALDVARGAGAAGIWLGTNAANASARGRYARHGFEVVGERTFEVGGRQHHDVVMLVRFGDGVSEPAGAVAD